MSLSFAFHSLIPPSHLSESLGAGDNVDRVKFSEEVITSHPVSDA